MLFDSIIPYLVLFQVFFTCKIVTFSFNRVFTDFLYTTVVLT